MHHLNSEKYEYFHKQRKDILINWVMKRDYTLIIVFYSSHLSLIIHTVHAEPDKKQESKDSVLPENPDLGSSKPR